MARGRDDTPGQPSSGRHAKGSLANENRLAALGEALDQRDGVKRKPRRVRGHRWRRRVLVASVVLVVLIAAVVGGTYWYANYRFDKFQKVHVAGELTPISGQPFNILMIGSDSRAGLSGLLARQTGATTGSVAGQRSDVVKIIHVDPLKGTITMLSIPRDTVVTLLANQTLYGQFNRINVNFGNGPSLLAQTITANFGIPINQTIVVSFAGLINAADALGGVYLDFPYPSWDPYSGLRILHPGCQLVKNFQALAISRSRHFYYNVDHARVFPKVTASYGELVASGWIYDGTSDFGRIIRQDTFLRAMIDQAKKLYNPFTLESFLTKLPQGVALDANFSLHELVGLAVRFHGINANAIRTFTLPVTAVNNTTLGDVLYVQEPQAQEQFVSVFGSQLETPSNPPPNPAGQTPLPPVIAVTTPTTSTSSTTKTSTTTTTNPTLTQPNFDPRTCTP